MKYLLILLLLCSQALALTIGTEIGVVGSGMGSSIGVTTRPSDYYDGFYDDTCNSWSHNSTTPTLPTGDATCSLIEKSKSGITVAPIADGTGNRPAWTVTYPRAAVYRICATVMLYSTTATSIFGNFYDATAGATLFNLTLTEPTAVASLAAPVNNCTVISIAAAGSKAYHVQLYNVSGSTVVNIGNPSTPIPGSSIAGLAITEIGTVYVP